MSSIAMLQLFAHAGPAKSRRERGGPTPDTIGLGYHDCLRRAAHIDHQFIVWCLRLEPPGSPDILRQEENYSRERTRPSRERTGKESGSQQQQRYVVCRHLKSRARALHATGKPSSEGFARLPGMDGPSQHIGSPNWLSEHCLSFASPLRYLVAQSTLEMNRQADKFRCCGCHLPTHTGSWR